MSDVKVGEIYLSGAGCPVKVLELREESEPEWEGVIRVTARVEYVDETNNYGYGKGAIGWLPTEYFQPLPQPAHKCDICGEPANVLMFEPDVYYCWQCHADWAEPPDDNYPADRTCNHCQGTGIHWDGPELCEWCDGEGYEWWR